MLADIHAARQRLDHAALHDGGIAGMKAARDVGRGHQPEQRLVLAHLPWAEALAEIGIQIDVHHSRPPSRVRCMSVAP
jgi:hypothetical protein